MPHARSTRVKGLGRAVSGSRGSVGARAVFEAGVIHPADRSGLLGNFAVRGTGSRDRRMKPRYLAGGAAVWAFAYTCGYVALIYRQDESTVVWRSRPAKVTPSDNSADRSSVDA